ncbi:MAG TPA: hypothetical protein VFJ14_02860 [Nocardioidaceae bacterium]|nr:hypothetical protein [Nocardioidaceae bacterium]
MSTPANSVDPGWLSLRGTADVRARTSYTADLAAELTQHLTRRRGDGDRAMRLVDVGAGMGAGAVWLRSRLPVSQDWRLLDDDPTLLGAAVPALEGWARNVVAGVVDLPGLLADEPADVVTCQALLDVLTAEEIDATVASAVACDAAMLLSLSVTGEVVVSPPHPDDSRVAAAFNAHQRRSGRLGPDAGAYAAHALRCHGYAVTVSATPWHLGAAEPALVRAWLQGRAAAALEQEPGDADRIDRWWESRDAAAVRGELSAVVGHVDVLALPSGPVAST